MAKRLHRFSAVKQQRLDALMSKNSQGELTALEAEKLRTLVQEAEEMTLASARVLAKRRQRLVTLR
jgi:hypothetical protein